MYNQNQVNEIGEVNMHNGLQLKGRQAFTDVKPPLSRRIKDNKYLLLMFLPVIVYYIIFSYIPMYGVVTAFQKYNPGLGIFRSEFAGLLQFERLFRADAFFRDFRNTLLIGLYSILWGFPIPIIFALFINEMKDGLYKRFVQSVSYLPRFISMVVAAGMVMAFVDPYSGIINRILIILGGQSVNFMTEANWFRTIYIASDVWQFFGWNSIIYIAALSSINPELYESSEIDGATRFQKMLHVTLPGIQTTIIILLILTMGSVLNVGFEKILVMYNEATYETADVLQTYIYRIGIMRANYSFASAAGLFNSVVNLILLVFFNFLSRKATHTSLF